MNNVFNIFNAPTSESSPHGEPIYKWEYMDENGKLVKESKNIKEMINSFLPNTDYKAQISRGELELENANVGIVSKDYRSIPDNTVDIYNYLTALAALSKEQVAKLVEQTNKSSEKNVQSQQAGDKKSVSGRQIDSRIDESKPGNSQSVGNNDAGGSK